ncbi:exodeoxyribonuclease VII large subunit [Liquorilactobacillus oeni DSM 19972]|uniref:Exodeoxyribonuclease 7 large subunit n=1 Tax=Liquorilactobacillus oeni DSM 19972 TaxID=1423777 RepID=A0A0R1M7E5_9LACO|nr:exodeoxyribonuclease VII large subunit [Liquorilactobacillus oeni]KRL04253.1 exodeoxyribonuclease VII large subunit [Liquorilactobacillus oeni DSM 19972]
MTEKTYLTVSALTRYLKKKFDVDPYLGRVYLTGEISNFRMRPRAHQYFSLKDKEAKINAIMFRSAFDKVKFKPEEGMKVLVVGRVSLYEASGNYQIYVEKMEPDGVGALYQAYEQLKRKLAAEGIFSAPKKDICRFPRRIAVITSRSGAVIKDIMTTVRRRYPIAQIVLFPALVQGEGAAKDIVGRIKQVEEYGNFQTLIIGRGGGSIEDLWPFNEEIVARAIYECKIPVISSVGHETDVTIADLVADVRAATPTAAAELAVPVLSEEIIKIEQLRLRLYHSLKAQLQLKRQALQKLRNSYVFKQPGRLYESYLQKVDYLQKQIIQLMRVDLNKKEQQQMQLFSQLQKQAPTEKLHLLLKQVIYLKQRLFSAYENYFKTKRQKLCSAVANLEMLSPLRVMARGYGYATVDGKVVRSITQLSPAEKISFHIQGGTIDAKILNITEDEQNG